MYMKKIFFYIVVALVGMIGTPCCEYVPEVENELNKPYIPMIVPGNQWNELAENGSLPPQYQYERTYVTTIGKDTLINNIVYYKLLTAQDSLSNIREDNGFIREDTVNQKVYYKPIDKPERLLYDFHVQIGDVLKTYDMAESEVLMNVEKIDSVLIGVTWHKRMTVLSIRDNYYYTWIEGIGGFRGLLSGMSSSGMDGEIKSLLCFYQNGYLIYKPTETGIDDCYVWRYVNH
jgi:hypothetical protein